jgi:RHS repeat-associated protein
MNSADTFNRELADAKYSFNANDNFNADHTFDINGNKTEIDLSDPTPEEWIDIIGEKEFELSNHLGNVLLTVSDRKNAIPDANDNIDYYTADVLSAQDFYPFGMTMPGRKTAEGYRFGFNSMENDDELKGQGNSLDFGARIYDPRTGRWLSLDPLQIKYAMFSPYCFVRNNPIKFIDFDGKDYGVHVDHKEKTIIIKATIYVTKLHANEAQNAANHWRKENGKYQYKVGKGKNAQYYDVKFEIAVVPVKEDKNAGLEAYEVRDNMYLSDRSGESNRYNVVEPLQGDKGFKGEASNNPENEDHGTSMIDAIPFNGKRQTGAHEVGHILGLPHWSKGLMKSGFTREDDENNITKGNIRKILKNVGIGRIPFISFDAQVEPDNAAKSNLNEKNKKDKPIGFFRGKVVKSK